jgi:hypothetical protein
MFSGGSYAEVARWLRNFLASHAKREDPRVEVELESGDEREGVSYAASLRFGPHVTAPVEFQYRTVADNRGGLAWCRAQADRVRALARELMTAARRTPAGAG